MLIHFIPFFGVLCCSLLWSKETKFKNALLCSFLFFSLIAFRNGGSIDDSPVYINIYNIAKSTNDYLYFAEPYIQFICFISRLLGFSAKGVFFFYALGTSIFLALSIPYFINSKRQNILYWLGLFLIHYVSCANVIVQAFASSVILYSSVLQAKGYKKTSLFLYLISILIHSASIIAIVLWISIRHKRIFNKKIFVYIPILLLFFGLVNGAQQFLLIFENLIPDSYYYLVEMVKDNQTKDQKGVLMFFSFICYLITSLKIKSFKTNNFRLIAWIGTSLYFCFIFTSFGVAYLFRIAYYFMFFIPFAFAYIPLNKSGATMLSLLLMIYFAYVLSCYDTHFFQNYSGSINLQLEVF